MSDRHNGTQDRPTSKHISTIIGRSQFKYGSFYNQCFFHLIVSSVLIFQMQRISIRSTSLLRSFQTRWEIFRELDNSIGRTIGFDTNTPIIRKGRCICHNVINFIFRPIIDRQCRLCRINQAFCIKSCQLFFRHIITFYNRCLRKAVKCYNRLAGWLYNNCYPQYICRMCLSCRINSWKLIMISISLIFFDRSLQTIDCIFQK